MTLSIVLSVHIILIWLLESSHHLSIKTKSGSLLLVWVTRPALTATASEQATTTKRPGNAVPPRAADHTSVSPSTPAPPTEEDSSTHLLPDWTEELHLAAKDAIAKQLEQKGHEFDFAHVYPKAPTKPPQLAWNYAATHRVESLPQGGILIHLGDNCVLVLIPLPIVGCAIGKSPANGELFDHMREK
jgi:hypothetical protein